MTDGTVVAPKLPAALGRYRPEAVLGAGAMGVVYRAHDPAIDRAVAIKVMRTEALEPEARAEYLERFRVEVRAAGRCVHPAIVAVHDFHDDADSPFIVMEFVEGRTLSAILRGEGARAAAPGLAVAMLQVLDGLAAAHALGVVHRDVKPSNVMITPQGAAKITDFGIARLGVSSLTAAGGLVGTPAYMAPEQALGRPVDHRADLFAAAAVLFEILAGRSPFGAPTLAETLVRLTAPEPADLGPLAGTSLAPVLRRGLAKDPAARFGSAAEFAQALRAALSGGAPDATAPAADAATVVLPAASGASRAGLATAAGGTGTARFDAALLDRLREDLAVHLGPIAGTLLRRAAVAAPTAEDLLRACAGMIEEPAARAAFLRRHRVAPDRAAAATAAPATQTPFLTTAATTTAALPAAALEAAEVALAHHLGPIARVLVRKAAAAGGSLDAFLDRLAASIDRPEDAPVFRRRVRAELDARLRG